MPHEPLWSSWRVALAAVVALAVAWAWPVLGGLSEASFRALANGTIGSLTFGDGGHVALQPVSRSVTGSSSYDDDPSWSTRLELRIDGIEDRNRVRINARRLLYLPSALLAGLVLASPLGWRRRALALALGLSLLYGGALLSTWLTAAWLFARVPGLVYQLSAFEQGMLSFGYEAWVTALGTRYLLPIVIAVALIALLSRAKAHRASRVLDLRSVSRGRLQASRCTLRRACLERRARRPRRNP